MLGPHIYILVLYYNKLTKIIDDENELLANNNTNISAAEKKKQVSRVRTCVVCLSYNCNTALKFISPV